MSTLKNKNTSPLPHLTGDSTEYTEHLYEKFIADPSAIPASWCDYFHRIQQEGNGLPAEHSHEHLPIAIPTPSQSSTKQVYVEELISAYRHRGHQEADINPLLARETSRIPHLQLQYHRLDDHDLTLSFHANRLYGEPDSLPLAEIVKRLRNAYCGDIGAEFMHITDTEEQQWWQNQLERGKYRFRKDNRLHLLGRLTAAEEMENHLFRNYPGTKKFGLEGAETLIPLLERVIEKAAQEKVAEIVIGMAHRGRLNVLVNIMGKKPKDLFAEFDGTASVSSPSGDVKYHQGFSSNLEVGGKEMHLALMFNPSHLEVISPVVQGSVRARQDRYKDLNRKKILPVLVHGDAAFAGQGVVMETLQMSQTRAYSTGGTIHIVVNNQIGFTTSEQRDARSTEYCTDVAKIIQAPILHVNAEKPEAVIRAAIMACNYRFLFHKDIVIDLVCYRRYGHNEADDPFITQPMMYQKIKKKKTICTLYADQLTHHNTVTAEEAQSMRDNYRHRLDSDQAVSIYLVKKTNTSLYVDWSPYLNHEWSSYCDTSVPKERLQELSQQLAQIPEQFTPHKQASKIIEERRLMGEGEKSFNWGGAEILAYASLLAEKYPVRLVGQDSVRGTFSHRHARYYDQKNGEIYTPLQNVGQKEKWADFVIYDSLLSELAALAFEYGYATTNPNTLLIWEAQFGDFANGAQMITDQFISSGQFKWDRLSGLTMFLPHGYEGQGPEHSSARLERYMQLCAENNIQVCIPSTPAQIFHLLRRQVIRPLRKSLVVMTPKSLLRHPLAISTMDELAQGPFHPVIGDSLVNDNEQVTRLILCSGKVYYDLYATAHEQNIRHVAIVRLEQPYPFPYEEITAQLQIYPKLKEVLWCQEEPRNQGAWHNGRHRIRRVLQKLATNPSLSYVGRDPSASTAVGYPKIHQQQQNQLVQQALFDSDQ